ncbi:hypothetical protein CRE_14183 [Caenorhabditis remanei]|uniref:Uncharacterized protein n=1 Tax=Caenorhabditis remanei TaxID=31234 RepID=E3N1J3_CAERE|nr:hypothetical protein CRE_14183 [Caenorhabditis remanei]
MFTYEDQRSILPNFNEISWFEELMMNQQYQQF